MLQTMGFTYLVTFSTRFNWPTRTLGSSEKEKFQHFRYCLL